MATSSPVFPESALVTGADGFIGRALVRRLRSAGVPTTCTSRRPRRSFDGESWHVGDLSDANFASSLVAEVHPDVVFHLAAVVTGSRALDVVVPSARANLLSSVELLSAVTEVGCRRVVLIGSGDQPTGTETPCSPYAASKWAMHGYARMFHELYSTPVTTARPFMVYGPDQPDETKIVPYVITSLLRGDVPALTSGRRRCDWVYVDDVVDGLLAVLEAPDVLGQLVDLGTGELRTVRDVVDVITECVGTSVTAEFGAAADRPGETEYVADAVLAARQCGWTATTTVEAGIESTVEWHRQRLS